MKTQQDHSVRIVALENLRAMCGRVSGMCHNYHVVKVSRSRIHVEYSNPDEYGHDNPMTAVFPCYPSCWPGDEDNPRVVLDIMRVINDSWDGEGWQAFSTLLDCPQVWRDPDGKGWSSEREILQDQTGATIETAWDRAGCKMLGWIVEIPGRYPVLLPQKDEAVISYLKEIRTNADKAKDGQEASAAE